MNANTQRNSVVLTGRPGRDPEVKVLNNNRKMARFSIAVNDTRYNALNERINNTQWFNIIAWGNEVEKTEAMVHKGQLIVVYGQLHNNEWKDKDGNRRVSTEIYLSDVELVSDMDTEESVENKGC